MDKVYKKLDALLKKHKSVLSCIDEVENLKGTLSGEELTKFVNTVRGIVQEEAKQAVIKNNGGMITMATGSGKSRVAVELAKYYYNPLDDYNAALLVPTEKLRDENWQEEFEKWEAKNVWRGTERLCYASASKIKDYDFPIVILDEGHNITELSSEFFSNNKVERTVLLTATPPSDPVKKEILKSLGIKLVYEVTLDQAVRLGFVAPYKITVVSVALDNTTKNIPGGTKLKPFMTTESAAYAYHCKAIQQAMFDKTPSGRKRHQFAILRRMQFIYKIPSKTEVIKFLLEKVIPQDDRSLIFCGSIEQAEAVCPNRYHSKSGDKAYNAFKAEEINRLSCVKAINEGHNFPGVDSGIVGQLNSKEKDLVQRINIPVLYKLL